MTRWIALAGIVLLGVAAIVWSEKQEVDAEASPAPLLYLVADTEQELTRLPVSFTRLSDADEIRIGNDLARGYGADRTDNRTSRDLEVERYLTQVGMTLAAKAHRQLPYQFHYLPDPYFINAFALPGGHVFVGGGLLALMDSEDELANILGHEIEHIDHYHCAERAQQQEALRKIPLGSLAAIPMEIFEAGYTKDQELEADREGTRLAVQDGYSANGAIRMFETFQRLYEENHTKAKTPQEELSRVAAGALEGYFRSHPMPSERIAQIQKLIASEGWPAHSERDLSVAYIYIAAKAQQALAARRYPLAEQLATRSLQLRPNQEPIYEVLADAQFGQAKFALAANSYRGAMDHGAIVLPVLEHYALSLAASDRQSAANTFRRWTSSQKQVSPDMEVIQAGLELVSSNPAPAKQLVTRYQTIADDHTPVLQAELGWWYYLSGNYQTATDLLSAATQQRPGEALLWTRLAWSQIEVRRISDAIQSAANTPSTDHKSAESAMVEAVGFWQAKEIDQALNSFSIAVGAQPEWQDPAWVKGLYSPLVLQSIHEMQTELDARHRAHLATTH